MNQDLFQKQLSDPIVYQYYDNLLNRRTIILNEDVTEDILEKVILPLKTFEKDNSDEPVTLILQTSGGSVIDGLTLINIIDNYKKKLKIVVMGYALSMGFIILCAGNNNPNVTKYCYYFSMGLLHSGNAFAQGESMTVADIIDWNRKVDSEIKNYICNNTKITLDEYEKNERKQLYMTSKEMKEKGLIDFIIGVDCDDY